MEETRVWTLFFLSSVRIYYHCYYYYREENGREFRTKRWLERRKERKKETIARERMPSFRIRIRDENRKLSVAKKRFPSYVISQTCFRAVVFCARRYCQTDDSRLGSEIILERITETDVEKHFSNTIARFTSHEVLECPSKKRRKKRPFTRNPFSRVYDSTLL